jgi:hypothetical protein
MWFACKRRAALYTVSPWRMMKKRVAGMAA